MRVHLPGMHCAPFAHESEDFLRLPQTRWRRPGLHLAWVHQGVVSAEQKAVIDEEILLEREGWIQALEIACTLTVDPMAQRQILCAGWRTNRIRLHESEFLDGAPQRGGLEQRARNRIAAQVA